MEELRVGLSAFNSFDLLRKIGAMNLLPLNASRRITFDALAHLVAAQPYDSNAPTISRHRLESFVRKHLTADSEPGRADDPAPEMFTEEITFPNGPFVVFPGTLLNSHEILKWLLKATLLKTPQLEHNPFGEEVIRAALLCLSVSNAIAQKAGIQRGVPPQFDSSREIVIPAMNVIKKGADAVTFYRSELISLTVGEENFDETMDPLAVKIGEVDWEGYSFEFGQLHHRPFVCVGDRYVVSDPSWLMSGLLHRIYSIALKHGKLTELANVYRGVIWSEIEDLLRFSSNYHSLLTLPDPKPTAFTEGLFTLDSDKMLYVQLATDDRIDFIDRYEPASWNISQLQEELERRNTEVVKHFSESGIPTDRILTLTVLESTGRKFVIGFGIPPYDSLQMAIPASSFRAMCILDGQDPLWLWKFARVYAKVHEQRQVMSWDVLDEYAVYRNRKTYQVSNDPLPELIIISPGEGREIKQSISDELDPHGVPAFETGYLIEVWSAFGNDAPVSVPTALVGSQPALVIEGELPIPLWITGQERIDSGLRWLQKDFVEMVAFWMWQFESIIAPSLKDLPRDFSMLRIDLLLEEPSLWLRTIQTSRLSELHTSSLITEMESTQDGLRVSLHASFLSEINGPDNQGERKLVRELLLNLGAFLRSTLSLSAESLTVHMIDYALDILAPLGPKKKLVLVTGDPIFYEGPGDIPPFREVQEADHQGLLDYIGEHLLAIHGARIARSTAERNALVNDAVTFLYSELQQIVATFHAKDLLTKLVAHNESNVKQRVQLEMTIATRLACFGERDRLVENFSEETHSNDLASLANRFLIEFSAAQQPCGTKKLSLEDYDRLLALASEICNLGMLSDIDYFGMLDTEVRLLTSGRLEFDDAAHQLAQNSFISKLMGQRVVSSEREFPSHWHSFEEEQSAGSEPPSEITAFDQAFVDEFGLSLTDLLQLLREIYQLGARQEPSIKELTRNQMTAALSHSLEWGEDKVFLALRLITLGPREDFMIPLDGSSQEVYPWRFNRSWSFLRRPLLTLGYAEDSAILWGNRQLILTTRHLVDLCTTGRLKATTGSLKRVVGDIRQTKAEEFEATVGRLVSDLTGMPSKVRVRKVGGKKIVESGRDLGDIDVLGVIPSERTILCVECKALALARTPAEVRYQLEDLFSGSKNKVSTTQKHLKRVKWVEENLDLVLEECFSVRRKGSWKVKPILVSDSELYASYLGVCPFSAWSIETLRSMTARDIASDG